jgi:ubiquinone/menaquinone biosynthesis C-methylase UbiE
MPLKLSFDQRPSIALGPLKREDSQVKSLYDRHAKHIHVLFGGVTENLPYRRKAIARLNVAPNSSVLDVACGIGSNFKIIEGYLRNSGTLVGIDISSESLKIAKKLVAKRNWTNVQLVNTSITEYRPKKRFDAILCTFALEIIADYRAAIDNMFQLLTPNGRFAMLGMKSSSLVPYTGLNSLVQRVWRKAGIDTDRDLVGRIELGGNVRSYEECLLGFYYVLSASRQNTCSADL